MCGRLLLLSSALVFSLASLVPAADPVAPAQVPAGTGTSQPPAALVVVLRNGEILSGQVKQEKDRYIVTAEGTEIRLSGRDVDFICRSLDDAYIRQRDRAAAGQIEDRLRLINWCLRHRLLGYAATELAAAMETNPRHPGIAIFDQRLRQAIEQSNNADRRIAAAQPPAAAPPASIPNTSNPATLDPTGANPVGASSNAASTTTAAATAAAAPAKARAPLTSADLDRLSRSLPDGTVEHFIENVQPLLINSCSTVGCHGPSSKSEYALIRPAANGRLAPRGMSQRNLFNTFEWVDHKQPHESQFLVKAREPHGGKPVGILAENSVQYRQLVDWVRIATGATTLPPNTPATIELTPPGTHAQVGSPFRPSEPAPYVNNPATEVAPVKPIEPPKDEKPFFEQPPAERKKKPYGV